MLREISLFGALAPSPLLYLVAALPLYLVFDRAAAKVGIYHFLWHPPLARLAFFVCVFTGLILLTKT